VSDIDTMRSTQVATGSLDLMSPEDKFLADRVFPSLRLYFLLVGYA
jgi:hypothetical protein